MAQQVSAFACQVVLSSFPELTLSSDPHAHYGACIHSTKINKCNNKLKTQCIYLGLIEYNLIQKDYYLGAAKHR